MNAVNLLPPDLRRGVGAPARSGIGVYVLLGMLCAAVLLAAGTALHAIAILGALVQLTRRQRPALLR